VIKKVSPFVLGVAVAGVLAGLAAAPAQAGAFLQEQGRGQFIFSSRLMDSRLAYDSAGFLTDAPRYRKRELGLLFEYGLTPDSTLILNPVWRDLQLDEPSQTRRASNIASFEAGARWRLADFDTGTLSLQATLRVPAGSDPFFWLENRPRTEMRLGYGQPLDLSGRDGFMDVSLAWIKRQEALPDEVRLDLTLGWWANARRMVMVQYFNAAYPGAPALSGTPRQHKIETSSVYKLSEEWSLQFGTYMARGGVATRRESGTTMALWRRL
jgi:hypothetical protein